MDLPLTLSANPDFLIGTEKGQPVLVPLDADVGSPGKDAFAVARQTAAQQAKSKGGNAAMLTSDDLLLGRNGLPINAKKTIPNLDTRSTAMSLWLPFSTDGTKSRLRDRQSYIPFANSAISGGVKLATQAAVTIAITTGVVTDTAHSKKNGDIVIFGILTGSAGVVAGTIYFVTSATANTWNFALTPNGTPIAPTSGGSAIAYTFQRNGAPGAQFNGADYLQSDYTAQIALQNLMRLDTLAEDGSDCIIFYGELTHGPGMPGGVDGGIFYWGRRATGSGGTGWGLSIAAAPAHIKYQFEHNPVGSSVNSIVQPISSAIDSIGDGPNGSAGTGINTKSAICMSVSKMPNSANAGVGDLGNSGSGQGLFYIEFAKRGLTDVGFFGQKDFVTCTPFRLPAPFVGTATRVADFVTDTGITLGMHPGSSPSTVTRPLLAGQGLDNVIFQRRKRQGGMVETAVRQGAANYRANPLGQPVQPAVLATV